MAQKSLLAPSTFPFLQTQLSSVLAVQSPNPRFADAPQQKPLTPLKLYKSQGTLITQSEPIIPNQAPQSMGFADSCPQAFCLHQDYARNSASIKHPHPDNI